MSGFCNSVADCHPFVRKTAIYLAEQHMLANGRVLAVAVSGGADSLALLHVLAALRSELGLRLGVAHVNHGLRGGDSEADQALVTEQASRLELPLRILEIPPGDAPAVGLEEWAREQRLAFFGQLIRDGFCQQVATGHTQRDHAETVLFRLLRGAGPSGLAGIAPVSPLGLIRPLLWATREELLSFLREHGIPWREDGSNTDPRFARNRLRNHWLPALREAWNPNLDQVLASTAKILRDENEYLDRMADEEIARQFRVSVYGWEARADRLAALPAALLRRMLRIVARRAAGTTLSFEHLEQVKELLGGPSGATKKRGVGAAGRGRGGQFAALGVLAERSGIHFRMAPSTGTGSGAQEQPGPELQIRGPGRYPLPGGRAELIVAAMPTTAETLNGFNRLDSGYTEGWSFLSFPFPQADCVLRARLWRPGETFQPTGTSRPRKLKEWFQRRGVPRWRRSDAAVLEWQGKVLWCQYLGVSALGTLGDLGVTSAAIPGSEGVMGGFAVRCETKNPA